MAHGIFCTRLSRSPPGIFRIRVRDSLEDVEFRRGGYSARGWHIWRRGKISAEILNLWRVEFGWLSELAVCPILAANGRVGSKSDECRKTQTSD